MPAIHTSPQPDCTLREIWEVALANVDLKDITKEQCSNEIKADPPQRRDRRFPPRGPIARGDLSWATRPTPFVTAFGARGGCWRRHARPTSTRLMGAAARPVRRPGRHLAPDRGGHLQEAGRSSMGDHQKAGGVG